MFMKRETKKPVDEQRRIVAHLDGLPPFGDLRQAKVSALPAHPFGRLQSATWEELRPFVGPLRALLPSHGDCRCFARRTQSAEGATIGRGV